MSNENTGSIFALSMWVFSHLTMSKIIGFSAVFISISIVTSALAEAVFYFNIGISRLSLPLILNDYINGAFLWTLNYWGTLAIVALGFTMFYALDHYVTINFEHDENTHPDTEPTTPPPQQKSLHPYYGFYNHIRPILLRNLGRRLRKNGLGSRRRGYTPHLYSTNSR